MNSYMPRLFTYSMALAELITCLRNENRQLTETKFEAIRKVWELIERYAQDSFCEEILDVIMEKKTRMILDATTIHEVREIIKPPKPYYDGCSWHTGKYSVPEEEMILWSKVSLLAPLVHEAQVRYEKLAEEFFGKDFFGDM